MVAQQQARDNAKAAMDAEKRAKNLQKLKRLCCCKGRSYGRRKRMFAKEFTQILRLVSFATTLVYANLVFLKWTILSLTTNLSVKRKRHNTRQFLRRNKANASL
jgi:hypothetical protein